MATSSEHVYSAAEHRLLSWWLGVPPVVPIDPKLTWSRALRMLGVRKCPDNGRTKGAAAVARIVLRGIEHRLPVWTGQGLPAEARVKLKMPPRGFISQRARRVLLVPRLVLAINWANSGPGIAWPSRYHVTFLPLYNRFIVTESQDTDEVHGYYDFAIGHFDVNTPLAQGCEAVLRSAWERERDVCSQEEWSELWEEGAVSGNRARVLRRIIWRGQSEHFASLEADLEDCIATRRGRYQRLMQAFVEHAKYVWRDMPHQRPQAIADLSRYVETIFNATRHVPVGNHDNGSRPIRIFPEVCSKDLQEAVAELGEDYWDMVRKEADLHSQIDELLRPVRDADASRKEAAEKRCAADREKLEPFIQLAQAAEWERASSGPWSGLPNHLRERGIIRYAIQYQLQYGELPTGDHAVQYESGLPKGSLTYAALAADLPSKDAPTLRVRFPGRASEPPSNKGAPPS
jgi:hypothetical protein